MQDKKNMTDKQRFLLSILIAMVITYALTFVEYWQLIVIPGLVAGVLNKNTKKGSRSGAIGVFLTWFIYIVYAIATRGTYIYLDQFAGLIVGSLGYGWILIVLVLVLGIVFGALSGFIGSAIAILYKAKKDRNEKPPVAAVEKPNQPAKL